jgi:ABC-type antimicrobial peptide transport system ATPase subunit
MIEDKDQMRLLQAVRTRRAKYESAEKTELHRRYFRVFWEKHKLLILGTLGLLVAQGAVETILIVIGRSRLAFENGLNPSPFFWGILTLLLGLFIVNSFFSIKQEKTLTVTLINNLRRRIFKNYLGKAPEEMKAERQADLIAKISYHLPLVSMGISNSFFGIIRWLIYLVSAAVVAYLAGLNVLLISGSFLALSAVIAVAAYFTVKQYISQEVTFYSQILKHVNLSLSEKYFSKNFNLEPVIMRKFDRLVNFDSIFRIRRDLWMKMGAKIIFALLLVVSVLSNIFYNDLLVRINLIRPELKFLYVFLLIYLSRVAYEALRVGLYIFPAKLGFSLTNVPLGEYQHRGNIKNIRQEIIFYSPKTKLFKAGKYYHDLKFIFSRGGRYLFYGSNLSGKTVLAKLFFGGAAFNPQAIKIKIDGRRLDFPQYQKKFNQVYFFDPNFNSQKSLLEIIIGADREETPFAEIAGALAVAADYPAIAGLVSPDNNFNVSAGKIWGNYLSAFALQALHCLVAKPSLIIIDNLWLDLDYPRINEILQTLSQKLPEAIIIAFANKNQNNLNYDKRYDLDRNFAAE